MEIDLIKKVAKIISDNKAENLVAIDVRKQVGLTDCFIIATGQSETHLKFLLQETVRELKKQPGIIPFSTEGNPEGGWILVDYGHFVLHLFSREKRDYYNLDRLWADAPVIFEAD